LIERTDIPYVYLTDKIFAALQISKDKNLIIKEGFLVLWFTLNSPICKGLHPFLNKKIYFCNRQIGIKVDDRFRLK
jgi:hypothetical protein